VVEAERGRLPAARRCRRSLFRPHILRRLSARALLR
jgi:hypothetical protein